MALQSKLFRGDPRLEAAAVSDPAHILLGASGPHVHKIQTALMLLEGASISGDEVPRAFYGPSTAAAVLAYKQKRNIINRSYQTQADNIVGKMTMASLDNEMLKREILPPAPVRIKPLSYWRLRPPRSPAVLALLRGSGPVGLNVARGFSPIGDGRPLIHILPPGPTLTLEVPEHGTGTFQVINGVGGTVTCWDSFIGVVVDPAEPLAHGGTMPIRSNPHFFTVRAGFPGRTVIKAVNPHATGSFLGSRAFLDLVVQNPKGPTDFRDPEKPHDHQPCGRWQDIRANPNNALGLVGAALALMCRHSATPRRFMDNVIAEQLDDKPIALQHINWFLRDGQGSEFVEDHNIEQWLLKDKGIRKKLRFEIFRGEPSRRQRPDLWKTRGHFDFDQTEYDNEDFQAAFGAIDWVDYDLDFGDGSIHVWFKDRYEWHPYYPGPPKLYEVKLNDAPERETNCLHAAGVELKSEGARDFWMQGEAFVPFSLITDEV